MGEIVQNFQHAATHLMRSLLPMLRPQTLLGSRKLRTGRAFDGGYIMIDDFIGIEAAYSIGINDDVSWDVDVADRGIPVFQYDHTIEAVPAEHPLTRWRKIGLAAVADPAASLATLPQMIAENGHGGSRDLILKCDVEGHEWAVLGALPAASLQQFRQIVMEIHCFNFLGDPAWAELIKQGLASLTASHNLVHIHGNNYAEWSVVGGIPVPSVMEVTLMRQDMGDFIDSEEIFPTALDMPCNPDAPDYFLGRFTY
jgi:hypothetical protein